MKKIGTPFRAVAILVAALFVLAAAFKVGGAFLAAMPGLVPSVSSKAPATAATVYEVIPGKTACGISLGDTPYKVQAVLGWPDEAVDYSMTGNWGYDRNDGGYIGIAFESAYKHEEGVGSWSVWSVKGIQCFKPSVMGSLRTGVSDKAAVVAAFGEPNYILFWDDDNDKIYRIVLIYEQRKFAVTLDAKTGLVDGFILTKD